MRIIEYSPDWYEPLRRAAESLSSTIPLLHRQFVDYYYASHCGCKLFLALDRYDAVVGTFGVDLMRFETESGEMTLGFGSNHYSLRPGVGAFLFLQRLRSRPWGLVFGGTEDTHRVVRSLGWSYFDGIKSLRLNRDRYPAAAGESLLRKLAKGVVRRATRKRIGSYAAKLEDASRAQISVHPERSFSDDLIPRESSFAFRFAPSVAYLNWRYDTGLTFVHYRLFRIVAKQSTVGYVVINEKPDCLYVAQCDGVDPVSLAYGVMSSIVEVGKRDRGRRGVMLTSSHHLMQRLYGDFGFRDVNRDWKFAVGGYKQTVNLNPDTSEWLINYDWGDNGLHCPFLDQVAMPRASLR